MNDDGACTTTGSFADHDIEDGARIVQRTSYRLAEGNGAEFAPTETFFDALETAFIWAYLASADENGISDHVAAAIDDASAFTTREFADREDADPRTEALTTFYRHAARFHRL